MVKFGTDIYFFLSVKHKLNLPQCPAHFVVVHVGFRFPLAPLPGHLVGVAELELPRGALPGDDGGVGGVGQQLQQELPQLDLAGGLSGQLGGHATWLARQHHVRVYKYKRVCPCSEKMRLKEIYIKITNYEQKILCFCRTKSMFDDQENLII